MFNPIPVQVARFQKSQIVVYESYDIYPPRSQKQKENEVNLTRGDYNGYMSLKTKTRVKRNLEAWIEAIDKVKSSLHYKHLEKKPYLTFLTLTLPAKQRHCDKTIKRLCLTPYIENLKRMFHVEHYFWRAEPQANGNIHFHLILDSYIHHASVRKLWNNTLEKLGYISEFEKNNNHRNPNSTDIHKLGRVKNVVAYVVKYCTKESEGRIIEGRIHGCSEGIKKLTCYEMIIDKEMSEAIKFIDSLESTKKIQDQDGKYFVLVNDVKSILRKNFFELSERIDKYYLKLGLSMYERKEVKEERPIIAPSAVYFNQMLIPFDTYNQGIFNQH